MPCNVSSKSPPKSKQLTQPLELDGGHGVAVRGRQVTSGFLSSESVQRMQQKQKRVVWSYSLTLVSLLTTLARPKWESSRVHNVESLGHSVYRRPRMYCGRSDIRRGEWVREDNSTKSYRWSMADDKCQYNDLFSPDAFCNVMENQVILFIGDSLTKEMWRSLVALTNGVEVLTTDNGSGMARTCSNKTQLPYFRSNRLHHLQNAIDDPRSVVPIELHNSSHADFPTSIVMNTGSWYQSTDVYYGIMVETIEFIRAWQELCKTDSASRCPFVWRTTPPGMPGCMEYNQPMNNITRAEELLVNGTSGARSKLHPHMDLYHWTGFREQNLIAEELFETSGLDYEIVDGYEIGITRPDNHVNSKDCLHHPGEALDVPDAWNTVLLHYLLDREGKKHFW